MVGTRAGAIFEVRRRSFQAWVSPGPGFGAEECGYGLPSPGFRVGGVFRALLV
jgi:hypothetical protein